MKSFKHGATTRRWCFSGPNKAINMIPQSSSNTTLSHAAALDLLMSEVIRYHVLNMLVERTGGTVWYGMVWYSGTGQQIIPRESPVPSMMYAPVPPKRCFYVQNQNIVCFVALYLRSPSRPHTLQQQQQESPSRSYNTRMPSKQYSSRELQKRTTMTNTPTHVLPIVQKATATSIATVHDVV